MLKRYKSRFLIVFLVSVTVAFALAFQFGTKGRNSFRNRTIEYYSSTISYLSIQSQHDWFVFVDLLGGASNESQVGWVSDIHADRFKRRTVASGTLYPKSYSKYLPKVFDELRKQKITTVIANGDNANSGDANYGHELEKIAYAYNMKVLWVKGNHDKDADMAALGFKDPNKYYYFTDFANTRLIVLDNTKQDENGSWINGGIDREQLNWLQTTLKTDKQVVIAMHIPVFPISLEDTVIAEFTELEKIMHDSGKVKLVLNGHLHTRWEKQFNGIRYAGQSALTRQNEEGGYSIIDLNNLSINNLYAK